MGGCSPPPITDNRLPITDYRFSLAKHILEHYIISMKTSAFTSNFCMGMARHAPTIGIAAIIILVLIGAPLFASSLILDNENSGQRRDGSMLWDIRFAIEGSADTDSLQIYLTAFTQTGETLDCISLTGDYPYAIGSGSFHIIWDIGADVPNREFYSDSIVIKLAAGMSGWEPGSCVTDIAIAAGGYHTVALRADVTVWAWGWNDYGALGDGTWTDSNTPVQVVGPGGAGNLEDIIAIAGGYHHTIALKSDGTVWTFGANDAGQLGDGTNTHRITPVQVFGEGGSGFLTDVSAIAGGHYHTIALKSDGTVWAWGNNFHGQLGDNTTTSRHTPVQVHGEGDIGNIEDMSAIAAGYRHTIALKADGTVWAWGHNGYGQLGDGTTTESWTPVQSLLP